MRGKFVNRGSDHSLHTSKKGAAAYRDNASFFANRVTRCGANCMDRENPDGANGNGCE
jgi:hypothetical protein